MAGESITEFAFDPILQDVSAYLSPRSCHKQDDENDETPQEKPDDTAWDMEKETKRQHYSDPHWWRVGSREGTSILRSCTGLVP